MGGGVNRHSSGDQERQQQRP